MYGGQISDEGIVKVGEGEQAGISTGVGYFDTVGPSSSRLALCYCFKVIGSVRASVSSLSIFVSIITADGGARPLSHVESPHIGSHLRARQSHELIVPLQEINPLQPLPLLHRGCPPVTINPLIKSRRYLSLRLARLHKKLLFTDCQTE